MHLRIIVNSAGKAADGALADEPMDRQIDRLATAQVEEIGGDHRGTPPAPDDSRKNPRVNALGRSSGIYHVRNHTMFFLQLQAPDPFDLSLAATSLVIEGHGFGQYPDSSLECELGLLNITRSSVSGSGLFRVGVRPAFTTLLH
jgi:hypothetical protein